MSRLIKDVLDIKGMSCGHCVKTVQEELKKLPLEKLEVSIGKVIVEYDKEKVNKEDIIKAIDEAGYSVDLSEKDN